MEQLRQGACRVGGPEHHAACLGRCSRNRKSQTRRHTPGLQEACEAPLARSGPQASPKGGRGPGKGGLQFLQSQLSLAKLHTWALKHQ